MPTLRSFAATAAASAALCAAGPAAAAPVTVNLRVEGPNATLYEGPVTTDTRQVSAADSSTHVVAPHDCDGVHNGGTPPNPHGYPAPGPTTISTLDDASKQFGFTWDGTWYDSFGDIIVNNVGPDPAAQGSYWTFLVNWKTDPNYGGCANQVQAGDDLVWTTWDFSSPFLQLSGTPSRAATGEQFTVTVQNQDGYGNATPAQGATVAGQATDAAGHATLSFPDAGVHTFKATKSGATRSNAQTVCVYVPGSGDCGTQKPAADNDQPAPADPAPNPAPAAPAAKDTTPPVVKIASLEDGKTYGRGPRVLSGDVNDAGGIGEVFLRLRATDGGDLTSASRCRWFSGKRGVFTHRSVPCSKARFFRIGAGSHFSYLLPARLRHGKYVLDVKVLDKSYNAGRASTGFGVK